MHEVVKLTSTRFLDLAVPEQRDTPCRLIVRDMHVSVYQRPRSLFSWIPTMVVELPSSMKGGGDDKVDHFTVRAEKVWSSFGRKN